MGSPSFILFLKVACAFCVFRAGDAGIAKEKCLRCA